MAELFNVIFRGDIAPGHSLAKVRECLRDHFKLDDARVDQLFSGRPVIVKKNLDHSRASQFRDLLADMGALAQLRSVEGSSDVRIPASPAMPAGTASLSPAHTPPADVREPLAGVTVEPPGADVLKPQERRPPVQRDIVVDHLSVDRPGADVLQPHERKREVVLNLDLSHLAVEPVESL